MTTTQPSDRQARPPRVPKGTRVYAIGDIHGRADLLARMIAMIRADAEAAAPERRVAVFLGDYIDRGPESAAVVDILIKAPLPGFETVALKGNHEDFLIRFVEEGALGPAWMINGGAATLVSYGVNSLRLLLGEWGLEQARRKLVERLPESHMEFYRRLKLRHAEGDYLFVHAGVRPGVAMSDQVEGDLLWIREEFLDWTLPFGPTVVHGHTISPVPEVRPNRIGIDTGAYASGTLTCLVLEGATRRFLAT